MTLWPRLCRSSRTFGFAVGVALVPGVVGTPAASAGSPGLGASAAGLADSEAAHNIRVSIGTLNLGEPTLRLRIRMFWDDLELAIMEHSGDMDFRLTDNEAVHTQIVSYINTMMDLAADDAPMVGVLTDRGIEEARRPDEVMWWYELSYTPPPSMAKISIRNRLLFNLFEDQRNILHVAMPNGSERAYYFSWDEDAISFPITR